MWREVSTRNLSKYNQSLPDAVVLNSLPGLTPDKSVSVRSHHHYSDLLPTQPMHPRFDDGHGHVHVFLDLYRQIRVSQSVSERAIQVE